MRLDSGDKVFLAIERDRQPPHVKQAVPHFGGEACPKFFRCPPRVILAGFVVSGPVEDLCST